MHSPIRIMATKRGGGGEGEKRSTFKIFHACCSRSAGGKSRHLSTGCHSGASCLQQGGVYYPPVGPQSTQSTCHKIYTCSSCLKWVGGVLADTEEGSNVYWDECTYTLWHPDKQRPQSLADLTYRVIKTPMMHSFLSSLLIFLVPLTSLSTSLHVTSSPRVPLPSLSLFAIYLSIDIFPSTSRPDIIYRGNISLRRQSEAV